MRWSSEFSESVKSAHARVKQSHLRFFEVLCPATLHKPCIRDGPAMTGFVRFSAAITPARAYFSANCVSATAFQTLASLNNLGSCRRPGQPSWFPLDCFSSFLPPCGCVRQKRCGLVKESGAVGPRLRCFGIFDPPLAGWIAGAALTGDHIVKALRVILGRSPAVSAVVRIKVGKV